MLWGLTMVVARLVKKSNKMLKTASITFIKALAYMTYKTGL
jgi:hypothetical protein